MANLLSLLKKAAEKGYREKVLLGQIIVITVSSTEPCSSQVLEGLKELPFRSSSLPQLPPPPSSTWQVSAVTRADGHSGTLARCSKGLWTFPQG